MRIGYIQSVVSTHPENGFLTSQDMGRCVVSTSLECIGYTQVVLTTTPGQMMTSSAYQPGSHGIGYQYSLALMKR